MHLVVTQEQRHYQLRLRGKKPIPMVAPHVKEAVVRPQDIQRFKEKVYKLIARPVHEVCNEIEERVSKYLKKESIFQVEESETYRDKEDNPPILPEGKPKKQRRKRSPEADV